MSVPRYQESSERVAMSFKEEIMPKDKYKGISSSIYHPHCNKNALST